MIWFRGKKDRRERGEYLNTFRDGIETRGRLYSIVSLALARQRLYVLHSLVEVSLPETKTDMEAGSEEEGAQV